MVCIIVVLLIISINLLGVYPQVCSKSPKPYNTKQDLCTYWFADYNAIAVPRALAFSNTLYTVHGWWSSSISLPIKALDYKNFTSRTILPFDYIDPVNLNSTIGCGLYKEYKRHGSSSGFQYDYWYSNFVLCHNYTDVFPHICRYDRIKRVNIVQAAISSELDAAFVGCVAGKSFVFGNFWRNCEAPDIENF